MILVDRGGSKTGMAQGQRAWLITTRTQDRDLLPVPVHIEFIALYGQIQDIEDIEEKTKPV